MEDPIAHSDSTHPASTPSLCREVASASPNIFRDSSADSEDGEMPSAAASAEDSAPATGDEFTFRGISLSKLNSSRHALWTQHRLAVGAPLLELCVKDVDAFMADALRIVWLCSHDPAVWSRLRSNPAAMEQAICEWADAEPIENAAELTLLGLRIYAAACPAAGF